MFLTLTLNLIGVSNYRESTIEAIFQFLSFHLYFQLFRTLLLFYLLNQDQNISQGLLLSLLYHSFSSGKLDVEYRSHLGKYGVVGDLAMRPISSLSGGQKSRVAFAHMTWHE